MFAKGHQIHDTQFDEYFGLKDFETWSEDMVLSYGFCRLRWLPCVFVALKRLYEFPIS